LDLGVGPGLLVQQLYQLIPNARIIGIDPSYQMLNRAKKNSDAELKIGSADNIPFENNSIDVIVTRYTLTYWNDANRGFQEINRVLKPGGFFIIESLNKDFSVFSLLLIKFQMLIKKSSWSVAQYHIDAYKTAYRIDSVLNLFNQNNFEIIRKDYKNNDWRFLVVGKKK
jgi:ubiquinone/menaquinone biosynthesis C-methylase UbiE